MKWPRRKPTRWAPKKMACSRQPMPKSGASRLEVKSMIPVRTRSSSGKLRIPRTMWPTVTTKARAISSGTKPGDGGGRGANRFCTQIGIITNSSGRFRAAQPRARASGGGRTTITKTAAAQKKTKISHLMPWSTKATKTMARIAKHTATLAEYTYERRP
eukprot:scaffold292164_cov28-Tisochrysis_lutea.AAC.2